MDDKLKIGQLFADTFTVLREYTLGMLPFLIAIILVAATVDLVLNIVAGSGLAPILSVFTTVFITAPVGVLMYRRALNTAGTRSLVSDSWALALAQLLVCFLFLILSVFVLLFLVLFTGILAGASGFDPSQIDFDAFKLGEIAATLGLPGQFVLSALVILSTLALVWASVRLILFGAATVNEQQVMIFRTWGWTKGHSLRLGVFCLCLLVPLGALVFGLPKALAHLPLSIHSVHPSSVWARQVLLEGPSTIIAFLGGHAAAIAVYRQLGPRNINYNEAFG